MFKKIAVAYNESAEAQRALAVAIQLAAVLGAELETITVATELPAYTAFASVADPELPQILHMDRLKSYKALHEKASDAAHLQGVEMQSYIVEGSAVAEIVSLLRSRKAELLVIGLHQRDSYIARLWSTVYELAQEAPCSVLGVH